MRFLKNVKSDDKILSALNERPELTIMLGGSAHGSFTNLKRSSIIYTPRRFLKDFLADDEGEAEGYSPLDYIVEEYTLERLMLNGKFVNVYLIDTEFKSNAVAILRSMFMSTDGEKL